MIKGWCLFSPQELGFTQGRGAPCQPHGVALSGCDGGALVPERAIRNSGLPPKFLLSPTEQTGRGFFASKNRECADNPNAPEAITAALSGSSPIRSFWETWDQPRKSKFIPLSLKQLQCFELQSQEEKGNNGKFLLSHVLTFFQRLGDYCSFSLGAVLSSDAPATSPWAPLPRILISCWHWADAGCSSST